MSQNISMSSWVAERMHQAVTLCRKGEFEQAKNILEPLWLANALDAEGCMLRGSIMSRLAKFKEAANSYRKSVALGPGNARAHFDLAKVLFKRNRFPEVEEQLQRALELEPKSAEVMFLLAMLYLTWRKPGLAENHLRNTINTDPRHTGAHYQLGCLLYRQGQLPQAEEEFKLAIKFNPSHINAYKSLGDLLMSMNQHEQAKAIFDKALSLRPVDLDLLAGLGKLYSQTGEMRKAFDLVVPHIEQGVTNPSLGSVFAAICHHFDRCQDAVDYLEMLLVETRQQIDIQERLHFLLGRLYDRLAKYDKAFEHFEEGNNLKPDNFNAVDGVAIADNLVRVCDWNYFVATPRSTRTTERPVFIVGMPRSGTTLTEQILTSHPDVAGVGEVAVLPDIIKTLSDVLRTGLPYPYNLKNLSTEKLDILANTYLKGISELGGNAPRVTDKMLSNFLHLGLVSMMFPKARVVHCKRDPRDTCLSIYFQNFDDSHNYANRLENIGIYYTLYEKIMRHWTSLLDIPILELQYEDLVENQEQKSRELIEFVGLHWNDQVLKFYESKRNVVTASYDQVRQEMYTDSTRRWKNYAKYLEPLINTLALPDRPG